MSISERITEKAGPLPVWAWGVGAGGIVAAYVWYRGRKNQNTSDTTNTTANDPSGVTSDTAGWGSSPYTTGVGVDGTGGDSNTNPATGDPYVTQPPDTGYYGPSGDLNTPDLTVPDAPTSDQSSPPAPVTPPPIVTPTPPRPAASFPKPVPGTVVWSGQAEPNKAAINGLIAARYGKPVSWHTEPVKKNGKIVSYKAVLQ